MRIWKLGVLVVLGALPVLFIALSRTKSEPVEIESSSIPRVPTEAVTRPIGASSEADGVSEDVRATELRTKSGEIGGQDQSFSAVVSIRRLFPRGLGAAVEEARDAREPERAYALAKHLLTCETIDLQTELSRAAIYRSSAGISRTASMLSLSRDEALQRECQSLQSDPKETRRELLKVAALGGIKGASAEYYSASINASATLPDVIYKNMAIDANRGDVWSMGVLVSDYTSAFALTDRQRAVYLNALAELAGGEGGVERSASAIFSDALRIAAANNGLPDGAFFDGQRPIGFSADLMKKVLIGKWAVTDPEGVARVQALVEAAKRS